MGKRLLASQRGPQRGWLVVLATPVALLPGVAIVIGPERDMTTDAVFGRFGAQLVLIFAFGLVVAGAFLAWDGPSAAGHHRLLAVLLWIAAAAVAGLIYAFIHYEVENVMFTPLAHSIVAMVVIGRLLVTRSKPDQKTQVEG